MAWHASGVDAASWSFAQRIPTLSGELQRELAYRAPVAVHEVADMLGHGNTVDIASGLDFGGNRFRNVDRPMLKCVEGDNADWVIKLASQESAMMVSKSVRSTSVSR